MKERPYKPEGEVEYIVVTDKTSNVVKSTTNYLEALRFASQVRKCDGEVTIFKSLKS